MSQLAAQQLDSIHSMLSAGHRNLRIERHSLVLWGACCGGLIWSSDRIFTIEQFPSLEQRALGWLILLALSISGVCLVDWHLTRRVKQARDEAWSFIHRQVLKVWWLLMAVGVLLTFATFFYGGGYMVFAAWMVLFGLGLYVHGLFSEELLEWIGALIIAIGIAMVALHLHYADHRRLAASTAGLGLPLLSMMLDRGRKRPAWVRALQSGAWLLCVLTPPLLARQLPDTSAPPDAPVVSVEEFRAHPARQQAVVLSAGMVIPVKVEVTGNVFRASRDSVLPLVLDEPVEIMMNDGQPTGYWRTPGGSWSLARDGGFFVTLPWLKAGLTPQTGPEILARLSVEAQNKPSR